MAKSRVRAKHELEKDEVAESVEEFLRWYRTNRLKIFTIGGLAILIVVVGVSWKAYRYNIKRETSQVLNAAHQVFDQLPAMQDEETRRDRLEDMVARLQTLIDQFPDSEAARNALLLQGNCYYYMDETGQAKASYQRYVDLADTAMQRARGRIALGYALENEFFLEGEVREVLDEAFEAYGLAETEAPADSYIFFYALMNQARLLELQRKNEEALEIYERIVANRASPRYDDFIEDLPEDGSLLGSIDAFARRQLRNAYESLSLKSFAELRAERLRAHSQLVIPSEIETP